ncbi:MAG: hypothetical protein R3C44_09740 [Chloroflexota bacterium]
MNVLPLSPEERITAALPVDDFDDGEYLIMITRLGKIKRGAGPLLPMCVPAV